MRSYLPCLSCGRELGRMDSFTEIKRGSRDLRDILGQLGRPFSGFCPGLHSVCACLPVPITEILLTHLSMQILLLK